jgi:hypothetical protein
MQVLRLLTTSREPCSRALIQIRRYQDKIARRTIRATAVRNYELLKRHYGRGTVHSESDYIFVSGADSVSSRMF